MELVYFSKTNNIKRFVNKLPISAIKADASTVIVQDYILLTYTRGLGEIPEEVELFLKHPSNQKHLVAVAGSGNRNWGNKYCGAVDTICQQLNVPTLMKFEMSGNKHDVTNFMRKFEECTK